MMKRNILVSLLVVGAIAAISLPSQAQKSTPTPTKTAMHKSGGALNSSDKKFVVEAGGGGLAEVKLGELAAQKASNADVKQFGERMMKDHSQANEELEKVASGKGVTLPKDLDAKNKATYDRLSKLSGAAFDKAYMSDMVKDHKGDVAAFQREARSGKDPDVKSFASKALPTLQDHLKMAQQVASEIKGGKPHGKMKKGM